MEILELIRFGIGLFALAGCFTSRKSLCVFGLDGLFSAAGSIAGAAISAKAQKEATKLQLKAIEKQQKFIFDQLEPGKLSSAAEAQDVARAKAQRALQGILDPELARSRLAATAGIEQQLAGLQTGAGDIVAQQAAQEALGAGGNFDELKQRLIDTALAELDMGAQLPQDVQAELVKAGLERGSQSTGGAGGGPGGLAGQETRRLIGQEGIKLQADRQARAAVLGQAAQELESRRAAILGSLFPALKQSQLSNLQATQDAFTTINTATPEPGLSGKDLTNIWLQRVGAVGGLMGKAGDVTGANAQALGSIWSKALGTATGALAKAGIPSSIANAIAAY